jgi:hypothetical protein
MGRPSIVPEIQSQLEPWLEARMAEWQALPEKVRRPNLPSTNDGKVNVREVTYALGLRRSQEQHFYNHDELRALVNAAAEAQGLAPIGSRGEVNEDDEAVRKRMVRISGDRNDLARTLAEREAVIERLRSEISSLREQLVMRDENGMIFRVMK